jgi:hypothetical protein
MRVNIDPETKDYIQTSDKYDLTTCEFCDNIHLNLFEEIGSSNYRMFATCTISLDQIDAFAHKLNLLRNEILLNHQEGRRPSVVGNLQRSRKRR